MTYREQIVHCFLRTPSNATLSLVEIKEQIYKTYGSAHNATITKALKLLSEACILKERKNVYRLVSSVRKKLHILYTNKWIPDGLSKILNELTEYRQRKTSSRSTQTSTIFVDVPSFKCPVTLQTFTEPVICTDGHTYEKDVALKVVAQCNSISPLTRQYIRILGPNIAVKNAILELGNKLL